jgi:hypothetical protein
MVAQPRITQLLSEVLIPDPIEVLDLNLASRRTFTAMKRSGMWPELLVGALQPFDQRIDVPVRPSRWRHSRTLGLASHSRS